MASDNPEPVTRSPMNAGPRDLLFGLAMLAVGALLWWETTKPKYLADKMQDYGFDPAFFPRILIGLWILTALAISVRALKVWQLPGESQNWPRLLGVFALTGCYAWAVAEIGFLMASIAFTPLCILFLGYRRPIPILLITLVFPLATWYCFVFVLKIQLPVSPWFSRI
ncbi:MAG: tripartite tricarboxylate transporter TctB family protein [Burkholderiaceae bacterium]